MIDIVGEVDCEENLDFVLCGVDHPILLILSVWDLCGLAWSTSDGCFHSLSNGSSKEVPLKHGYSVCNFISDLGSLSSDDFVFFPDLILLLFVHAFFNLFGLRKTAGADVQGYVEALGVLSLGADILRV